MSSICQAPLLTSTQVSCFLDYVLALCTSAGSFAQPAATECFKHLPSSAADEHAGVLYVPCAIAVCAALLHDVQAQLHPCKTTIYLSPCWHESVRAKLIMTHLYSTTLA